MNAECLSSVPGKPGITYETVFLKEPPMIKVPFGKKPVSATVPLRLIVGNMLSSIQSVAARRGSILVNDVSENFFVEVDEQKLSTLFCKLLDLVITHTSNTQIRISAKKFGEVTILYLKEKSRLNSPAFAVRLTEIQQLAENIIGQVSVTSYRHEVTTVALSFVSKTAAA